MASDPVIAGPTWRLRSGLTVGVLIALVLTACGGSDEVGGTVDGATSEPAAGESAPSTSTADASAVTPAADSSDEEDPSPAKRGANTGVVTIGDTSYEFDATPATITDCEPDFFGAFRVIGETPGGGTVTILLPPEGDPNFDDPPSVRVKDIEIGADFTADPSIVENGSYGDVISEGDTQVDSFTVDGNTASGTATFVDEQQIFAALGGAADDPEPVQGTFEVTCVGE